jgi:hypothetical protein
MIGTAAAPPPSPAAIAAAINAAWAVQSQPPGLPPIVPVRRHPPMQAPALVVPAAVSYSPYTGPKGKKTDLDSPCRRHHHYPTP